MFDIVSVMWLVPRRELRHKEREVGLQHPIVVKTLAGDSFTLNDWGLCKGLKSALIKIAPDLAGKSDIIALLDTNGWTTGTTDDIIPGSIEVNTKYGSEHRRNMLVSTLALPSDDANGNVAQREIELTLVYSEEEQLESRV